MRGHASVERKEGKRLPADRAVQDRGSGRRGMSRECASELGSDLKGKLRLPISRASDFENPKVDELRKVR